MPNTFSPGVLGIEEVIMASIWMLAGGGITTIGAGVA